MSKYYDQLLKENKELRKAAKDLSDKNFKLKHKIAEMKEDINSVLSMLGGMEDDVDRQKIVNFIKEYLV